MYDKVFAFNISTYFNFLTLFILVLFQPVYRFSSQHVQLVTTQHP